MLLEFEFAIAVLTAYRELFDSNSKECRGASHHGGDISVERISTSRKNGRKNLAVTTQLHLGFKNKHRLPRKQTQP